MAVTLGSSTNLASGTGTRSWTSPTTASKAYGVVVISGGAVEETSGVTWGGAAMTRIATGANTSGESGTTSCWFIDAPGTGGQTVEITRSGSTAYIATAYDGTSATGHASVVPGGINIGYDEGSSLNISTITTSLTIPNGLVVALYGGLYSGENALSSITDNAALTRNHSQDFGNFVSVINRKTTTLTGTGSAYTSFAWTQSSDDGAWAVIAVQEATVVDNRNASVTGTGGGVYTHARIKGGQTAATATGGGIYTNAATKAGATSVTATGGGVYTHDYTRAGGIDNRDASVVATGGGIAVAAVQKGGQTAATATGGGVGTAAGVKGGLLAATATGGGIATLDAAPGAQASVTATGGGVLAADATTARLALVAATGGGVFVIDYAVSGGVDNRNASVTATGGGVAALVAQKDVARDVTATGAGVLVIDLQKTALAAAIATGGGTATLDVPKGALVAATATGGGVVTIDYTVASGTDNRDANLVLTGGGIATLTTTGAHAASITATGGGVFTIGTVQRAGRGGRIGAPVQLPPLPSPDADEAYMLAI